MKDYVKMLEEQNITYDYAVPQPWLDDIAKRLGSYNLGYVWVYTDGYLFGIPCPRNSLTECALIAIDEPYFIPQD